MERADPHRSAFRVIAEGDDSVGRDMPLARALALLVTARDRGKRHVAIVDDFTGAIVDEQDARAWVERGAPSEAEDPLTPCPACQDEAGFPVGDVLAQLPSGTWVRETCDVCQGGKTVGRDELARQGAFLESE
jgi:hypothetical protein